MFLDDPHLVVARIVAYVVKVGVGIEKTGFRHFVAEYGPCCNAVAGRFPIFRYYIRCQRKPVSAAAFHGEATGAVDDGRIFALLFPVVAGNAQQRVAGHSHKQVGQFGNGWFLHAQQVGLRFVQKSLKGEGTVGPCVQSHGRNVALGHIECHDAQLFFGTAGQCTQKHEQGQYDFMACDFFLLHDIILYDVEQKRHKPLVQRSSCLL